jgi:flagellar biosynthesis/type III secretory pathway protein FliH
MKRENEARPEPTIETAASALRASLLASADLLKRQRTARPGEERIASEYSEGYNQGYEDAFRDAAELVKTFAKENCSNH